MVLIDNDQLPRRRERLRNETLNEIKVRAWAQIAESGPAALSLRAVARDMGMTSSALYRYFESRDRLLATLAKEAFAALADRLEEVEAKARRVESGDRFLAITKAYRSWALEHATEYTLMFGTALPYHDLAAEEEMSRGIAVLFRVMVDALEDGALVPPELTGGNERKLRRQLRDWQTQIPPSLTPEALASCMVVWTQLHGAISLELFEHLPDVLLPGEALFDHLMRRLLTTIGYGATS